MKKIKIWGEQIPFNSPKSKLPDMEIGKGKNKTLLMLKTALSLTGKSYKDQRKTFDTYTYRQQIQGGFEKETYEDEAYLVPFLVEGSKQVVLVVPGGGYVYKQSDVDGEGKQAEGDLVAKQLNKAGISAFVLWYRSNPYRFPVPLVDMQRAVRYLKFHADDYGYDADKVSAIGFSAGGFQVSGLINLVRGKDLFPADYRKDAVDEMDDSIATAGLMYPCTGFEGLLPMMSACFDKEKLKTKEDWKRLAKEYSCVENFHATDVPQFVCYGGKDILVKPEVVKAYIRQLESHNVDHKVLCIPNANHGFGAAEKNMPKYGYWVEEYTTWLNSKLS